MQRRTMSQGTTPRRRLLAGASIALLVLAAAVAVGCGGSETKRPRGPTPAQIAARRRQMALGAQTFAKKCALCHTLGGKVAHPTFIESPIPNLDEVKPQLAYVRQRIEEGGFDMPTLSGELTPAQARAVVAYVAEVAGRNVAIGAASADQAAGQQVFQAHCQSCHAIAGRAATGRPAYPGTDFDKVRPSVTLIEHQVRRGIREEMPSFRGKLTAAQIEAVAHYVNAVAGR
jgi:cbb3-type cytochrome c oxidase subunit III